MEQEKIKRILIERGYSERLAISVSKELLSLNENLSPLFNDWLDNGKETDYSVGDFSISALMTQRGLKYPAAILTMDWIIKEPEVAIPLVSKVK